MENLTNGLVVHTLLDSHGELKQRYAILRSFIKRLVQELKKAERDFVLMSVFRGRVRSEMSVVP